METHEQKEKMKRKFENNLKQAVRNCKKLRVRNHLFDDFEVTPVIEIDDLSEDSYEDGNHSYTIGASIRIYNSDREYVEKKKSKVSFSATVDGTDVQIDTDVIHAEYSAFSDAEILQICNPLYNE